MRLPYELHLALRYLRFHRGRTFLSAITLISLAGVIVGSAALVIALSLMAGFVQDVVERIHSGSAHLTVLSRDARELFGEADSLIEQLESVDGVHSASPVLYTPALITFEALGSHGFVELQGIDAAGHSRVILGSATDGSPYLRLSGPTSSGKGGILLGQQLAARIGALEGDLVRVLVPKVTLAPWTAVPRSRLFEVVGTYSSEHFQEDAMRAYIAVDDARSLLRAPSGTSWVELRLDDLARLDAMKQQLRASFGAGWRIVDLIEQNRALLKALNTEKLVLFLAIGLIVVVAALNIVSTLILMVTDKVREIGTLTAMGARPAGVAKVFMLQGLVIGVLGGAGGLTLGTGASWWLDRYRIIQVNPEVYYLHYVPFYTQPADLFAVALGVLVISLLATLYPAFKAARLDPVEAIRYE